jgi:hypothetical protein
MAGESEKREDDARSSRDVDGEGTSKPSWRF